jgi:hypothetical protein
MGSMKWRWLIALFASLTLVLCVLLIGTLWFLKSGLASQKSRINNLIAPYVLDFDILQVDLIGGSVTLKDFSLRSEEQTVLLQLHSFHTRIEPWALFKPHLDILDLELKGLYLDVPSLLATMPQAEEDETEPKEPLSDSFVIEMFRAPPIEVSLEKSVIEDLKIILTEDHEVEISSLQPTLHIQPKGLSHSLSLRTTLSEKKAAVGEFELEYKMALIEQGDEWTLDAKVPRLNASTQALTYGEHKLGPMHLAGKGSLDAHFAANHDIEFLNGLLNKKQLTGDLSYNLRSYDGAAKLRKLSATVNESKGAEVKIDSLNIPGLAAMQISSSSQWQDPHILSKLWINKEQIVDQKITFLDNEGSFAIKGATNISMAKSIDGLLKGALEPAGYWQLGIDSLIDLPHEAQSIFSSDPSTLGQKIDASVQATFKQTRKGSSLVHPQTIKADADFELRDFKDIKGRFSADSLHHESVGKVFLEGSFEVADEILSQTRIEQKQRSELLQFEPVVIDTLINGGAIVTKVNAREIQTQNQAGVRDVGINIEMLDQNIYLIAQFNPFLKGVKEVEEEFKGTDLQLKVHLGDVIDVQECVLRAGFIELSLLAEIASTIKSYGKVTVDGTKKTKLFDTMSGQIQVPFNVQMDEAMFATIESDVIFENLSIEKKGQFSLNRLRGKIPLREELNLNDSSILARILTINPFERVDYLRQHPLIQADDQIQWDRLEFFGRNLTSTVAKVGIEQNLILVPKFDTNLSEGKLMGGLFLNVWPEAPHVGLYTRFNDLRLRPQQSQAGIEGRTAIDLDLRTRVLDGRIDISRISSEDLIYLLEFVDPDYRHERMNQLRSALKIAFPERVNLFFKDGGMDMLVKLNIGPSMELKSLPVAGFMNAALSGIPTQGIGGENEQSE